MRESRSHAREGALPPASRFWNARTKKGKRGNEGRERGPVSAFGLPTGPRHSHQALWLRMGVLGEAPRHRGAASDRVGTARAPADRQRASCFDSGLFIRAPFDVA